MKNAVKKAAYYSVKANGVDKQAIKDVDTTNRMVTGIYNTYNFLDSQGDILLPGCFDRSIKERGPKSDAAAKVVHACDHDLTRIPGKIVTLEEKKINYNGQNLDCLYFETKMASTTLGEDKLIEYAEGIVQNHSVGLSYIFTPKGLKTVYRVAPGTDYVSDEWKKIQDSIVNPEAMEAREVVWLVGEAKLWEGSSVAFGANSLTPNLGGKSFAGAKKSYELLFINRLSKLENSFKMNPTEENAELVAIQILQLKEMVSDFCSKLSPKKLGVKKVVEKIHEQKAAEIYDFGKLARDFKLT